jgi:lipoate-protein ligase A
VRGRKLVGSAQWRDGGALLQHGSVLVDDDQPRLAALALALAPVAAPPPAATLRAELGDAPPAAALFDALGEAVRELEDRTAATLAADAAVVARADALRARYLDAGWTWRR